MFLLTLFHRPTRCVLLLFTRVYIIFTVHNVDKFHQNMAAAFTFFFLLFAHTEGGHCYLTAELEKQFFQCLRGARYECGGEKDAWAEEK